MRRRTYLTTAGAAVVGVTAGCVSAPSGGGASELTIGIPHWGFNWDWIPHVVGNANGFFDEEGIAPERLDVAGGGNNVRAVISRDADMALGTGTFAIFAAYASGSDIRIVGNEMGAASDMWFISEKYDSIDALRGQGASIGYDAEGSSADMVVSGIIENEGLDAEAVTVGGPPDSLTAVKTGQVDVGWIVPEFAYANTDLGGDIHLAFKGSDVAPFDAMTIRGQIAKQSWLDENEEAAKSYWAAYTKGLDWVYDNLEETYDILAETIELDPNVVNTIMPKVLDQGAYMKEHLLLDAVEKLDISNDYAAQFGILSSKLSQEDLDTIVNLDYLP